MNNVLKMVDTNSCLTDGIVKDLTNSSGMRFNILTVDLTVDLQVDLAVGSELELGRHIQQGCHRTQVE